MIALYWFVLWCVMAGSFVVVTICLWRCLKIIRRQGAIIDELLTIVRVKPVQTVTKARIDN